MLVTTLPITPKFHAKATTLLSPLVAHMLASYLWATQVVSLNLHGLRFSRMIVHEVLDLKGWYLAQLSELAIVPDSVIDETDDGFCRWFVDTVGDMFATNKVAWSKREMLICPCGCVDLPVDYTGSLYGQGKVLSVSADGKILCRMCKSDVDKITSKTLELRLLTRQPNLEVYLNQYGIELKDKHNYWTSRDGLVISKSRGSTHGFSLSSFGCPEQVFDPEFVWATYLSYLVKSRRDYDVVLVANSRMLHQLSRVAEITSLICPTLKLNILVTPIVHIKKEGTADYENMEMREFKSIGSVGSRRTLLASGLSWKAKEAQALSRTLALSEQSLRFTPVTPGPGSVTRCPLADTSSFVRMCCSSTVSTLLAKLRKRMPLDGDQIELLRLLVG